jgi:hypothetical protein
LDLEYAKIELNTAQASIVVLETTISDLRFRNRILEDRINQFEGLKKNDVFEKYFPSTGQQNALKPEQRSHATFSNHCCHQLSHCCSGYQPPTVANNENVENIFAAISSIRADIEALKINLGEIAPVINLPNHKPPPPIVPTDSPDANSSGSPVTGDEDPHHVHHPPGTASQEQQPQTQLMQNLNSSVVSLDQEMGETDLENYLNCE